MIEHVHGRLVRKEPMLAVVDVHGIGYAVHITLQTYEKLPPAGETVELLAHLHVREDAMALFGFLHEEERAMFRQLQNISGIGVRIAMNILSRSGAAELRGFVLEGNVGALTRIPGVGKKTAERMILELRDVFAKGPAGSVTAPAAASPRDEALLALLSLGYARPVAEKALSKALQDPALGASPNTGDLIKSALRAATG